MNARLIDLSVAFAAVCAAVFSPSFAADSDVWEGANVHPQYIGYRSMRPQLECTKDFADMGMQLRIAFAANTLNSMCSTYCDYPPIRKDPKQCDWSVLDAQFEDLLKPSPNAQFSCEIDLNTPYWVIRKFAPESFTEITHAASDPRWIKFTKEWMLDFIAYAEKKWVSRISAYILAGGSTTEWCERDRGRTGNVKNTAWVRWCREHKLNNGETVPDLSKVRRAAFEKLVYNPAAINIPPEAKALMDKASLRFTCVFTALDTRLFDFAA